MNKDSTSNKKSQAEKTQINSVKLPNIKIIPEVYSNDDLSYKQMFLFGFIKNLANEKDEENYKYCYASNKYLGKLINLHETTVSDYICELEDQNYIQTHLFNRYDGKTVRRIYINDFLYQKHKKKVNALKKKVDKRYQAKTPTTIIIPAEVLFNWNLRDSDKLLFGFINNLSEEKAVDNFSEKYDGCWLSNQLLGENLGISRSAISKSIKRLKDQEYIYSINHFLDMDTHVNRRIYINPNYPKLHEKILQKFKKTL